MIIVWITSGLTIITVTVIIIVTLFLKRRLDKNKKGSRSYTYLMMYALIANLFMAIIMMVSLNHTVYVAELNSEMFKEQLKREPTVNPDIQISLTDDEMNKYLPTFLLASVEKGVNGEPEVRKNIFNFIIFNNGRREASMNAYLRDKSNLYRSDITRLSLSSLDSKFFEINYWHKNCTNELKQYDFNTAFKICQEVASKIRLGIEEFLLILDCPKCRFDEGEERCYSFSACTYNSSISKNECEKLWEESGGIYSKLEKTTCPKNWRY